MLHPWLAESVNVVCENGFFLTCNSDIEVGLVIPFKMKLFSLIS